MKNKRNWAIALILTVATGVVVAQNRNAPISNAITETAPVTATPTAYEGCAYTWAHHDAPDLTKKLSALVSSLNPNANVRAGLYGEDCIYADGHADFSVMETDFYVRLPVEGLTDEKAFGDWMAQVMQIIVKIPREELRGNYGFVEFRFEKSETEWTGARVFIQVYIDQALGKSGVELYRLFTNLIPK